MTTTTKPKILRFNEPMFQAIRDGHKTVTRRLVKTVKCKYQAGDIVHARCYPSDDVIPVRIVGVRKELLQPLSDDELLLEGVDGLYGFIRVWKSCYPGHSRFGKHSVWRIEFERIGGDS